MYLGFNVREICRSHAVARISACDDLSQPLKLRLSADEIRVVYATPRIMDYIVRSLHAEIALVDANRYCCLCNAIILRYIGICSVDINFYVGRSNHVVFVAEIRVYSCIKIDVWRSHFYDMAIYNVVILGLGGDVFAIEILKMCLFERNSTF